MPVLPTEALPEGTALAYARMRERFVSGLAGRWADIVAAETQAQRHFLLHRMSGAAGSFGCDELGLAAGRAEAAAEAGDGGALALALQALAAMIERMAPGSTAPSPQSDRKKEAH